MVGRNFGYPSGTPSQGATTVGELALVIEIEVFLKNIEVSGLTTFDGETFIGFLVPLRVRYRAHEQLTIEVGAVLGQDFGDEDELNAADPLVRLAYEPAADVFVVAGTILPTHWIHDALHDDTRKFRTGAEQGIQIRADRTKLKQDLWLNWRVREDDFTAEEFEVGNATQVRLFDARLWVDVQFLFAHVGGQKTSVNRVETNFSSLAGLSYGFPHPFGCDAIDEIRFGARVLYVSDDVQNQPKTSASGWEAFFSVDLHPRRNVLLRIFGSWYSGDEFAARLGDPLYALDDYGQLALAALFDVANDLRIEIGIAAQWTDDRLNYTFVVTFAWGRAFRLAAAGAR